MSERWLLLLQGVRGPLQWLGVTVGALPSFPTDFSQFETSEGFDLGSGAEPQG